MATRPYKKRIAKMKVSAVVNDIPLDKVKKRGKARKYPFYEMKVGESVLIESKSPEAYLVDRNLIATLISHIKRRYDMAFTMKMERKGKKPTFRVWRIS